ncbi:MAG: hypothetical protein ACYCQI_06155 [Gammaproteobacteria bacterium]
MTASCSKLNIKGYEEEKLGVSSEEAMPRDIHAQTGEIFTILSSYLDDNIQVSSPLVNGKRLTIFDRDVAGHVYNQAESIAQNYVLQAGRLEQLVKEVETKPRLLLPTVKIAMQIHGKNITLQGTLEQLAIITLQKELAATLRQIRKSLLPDTMPQVLEQEKITHLTDKKIEKANTSKHVTILQEALDLSVEMKQGAGDKIKNYIKNILPEVITDDGPFLSVLELNHLAFQVLAKKIRSAELTSELNPFVDYDSPQDRAVLAHKFCFEVIGRAIQSAIPDGPRQILRSGVWAFLYRKSEFSPIPDTDGKLGYEYFYDINGRQNSTELFCIAHNCSNAAEYFKTFYELSCNTPPKRQRVCRIM